MKTAMQELIGWINENDKYDAPIEGFDIVIKAIKLLEKEKEQIMKAYKDHHDLEHIFGLDTEQYFNQTYNN
jgi:fibronectin type 3 domain-containing protein